MNCLAFRNQSHQSHDHRHEQYPPRGEDKRGEVRETLHMNNKPYHHELNSLFTLSSNKSFICLPDIHVQHSITPSSLLKVYASCYISIYTSIFLCPLSSHCLPAFPFCPVFSALQLCESRDSDGRMEGGPEEERG